MYHVLTKNTTVTDHNRNLLVETIRTITEILIWGDQNDSSVFEWVSHLFVFVFFVFFRSEVFAHASFAIKWQLKYKTIFYMTVSIILSL